MVTHSSTLAWRIPWIEEPRRLQSVGSPRVYRTERLHFLPFLTACHGQERRAQVRSAHRPVTSDSVTPRTVTLQAPLPTGCPRQGYRGGWSGFLQGRVPAHTPNPHLLLRRQTLHHLSRQRSRALTWESLRPGAGAEQTRPPGQPPAPGTPSAGSARPHPLHAPPGMRPAPGLRRHQCSSPRGGAPVYSRPG